MQQGTDSAKPQLEIKGRLRSTDNCTG